MTHAFQQLWGETFRHAETFAVYYRELFAEVGRRAALGETADSVDKQVLSERNLDFLCVPREQVVEIVTTSGTTGQPLLVDADRCGRAPARAERKNVLRVRRA